MNYAETIHYIDSLQNKGTNGLENTCRLLKLLGNPQEQYQCLHVAGTNGKGSVCAFLHSILTACGYRTGLYISPYLERFEERMQINREIEEKELAETATLVRSMAEKANLVMSYFAFITCVALKWFAIKGCAYAVIETGLGGRLDPTSAITPVVSLITAIGKDHTHILGNTLADITREKCGIIKENIPVFVQRQDEEAMEVIRNTCQEKHCMLTCTQDVIIQCEKREQGQRIQVICNDQEQYCFDIALKGEYQIENAVQAFLCALYLKKERENMSLEAIYNGMKNAFWPGRMEFLSYDGQAVLLDGAHNPQGALALKESIAAMGSQQKITLLCGVMADKDAPSIVEQFQQFALQAVCTIPEPGRGLSPDILASYFTQCSAQYENDWVSALDIALKKSRGGLLVVAGSIYLCGKVRNRILHFQKS